MDGRKLVDTAGPLRRGDIGGTMTRTDRATGEALLVPAGTRRRHTALEQSPDQKDTIRTLRKDITRLNNEVVRRNKRILQLNKRLDQEKQSTETIRETARKQSSESLRLHREVRILGDSEARARSLSDEVFWLRHALEVS